MFGWNEVGDRLTNMAMDRIRGIAHAEGPYRPNTDIDFTEHFDDVVGVTVPHGPAETVEIQVSPELWPYVETKPLHGSQKVVKRDDVGITVRLQVKVNYELQALLLSHGEGLHVRSPENLRENLHERIRKMGNIYGE